MSCYQRYRRDVHISHAGSMWCRRGEIGHKLGCEFVDSLEAARAAKTSFLERGADSVHIYDTVGGEFYE